MSFKEAILNVFNNYANFNGRARRSEYWYFVLFTTLINSVLAGLQNSAGEGTVGSFFGMLAGLFSLATLIPGLVVCWRRLHDIGKSGGYYFLILIPLVGAIILLVWMCRDSEPGTNQYGPNPKEPPRDDIFNSFG